MVMVNIYQMYGNLNDFISDVKFVYFHKTGRRLIVYSMNDTGGQNCRLRILDMSGLDSAFLEFALKDALRDYPEASYEFSGS